MLIQRVTPSPRPEDVEFLRLFAI